MKHILTAEPQLSSLIRQIHKTSMYRHPWNRNFRVNLMTAFSCITYEIRKIIKTQ